MTKLDYTQSPITLSSRIRTAIFFLGYMASGMVHSVVSVLVAPLLPFRIRYRFVNTWCLYNLWWLRLVCGVRFEVIGKENIPDEPCVVMCNHQSSWETFMLQWIISPQATVLKKELLKIPFFGWGLWLLKPIAIDRSQPRVALKQLEEIGSKRIQEGSSVVIYPEGTRQYAGKPGKYNAGGAKLAIRAGAKVVPVAHNAGECWPTGHNIKLPGKVTMVIGEPISSEGKNPRELTREVQAWIQTKQQEISQIESDSAAVAETA